MPNKVVSDTNVLAYQEQLAEAVQQALGQTTFSNRMMIAPRHLRQIGTEEVESILTFLQGQDQQSVAERGRQLAGEGLGRESVLAVCTALRRFCWNIPQESEARMLFDLIEQYTTAFLDGYLNGLEEEIRQEQERTRQAYIRSLGH